MDFYRMTFLGNTVVDYVVSLVMLLIALIVSLIVRKFLTEHVASWTEQTDTHMDDMVVKRILTPLTYGIIVLGLAGAIGALNFSPRYSVWADRLLTASGLALFFVILIRIVEGIATFAADGMCRRLRAEAPEDLAFQLTRTERLRKQVVEISKMVLAGLAVLTILSNLGLNLKAVWASLGIGTIAVALAVQEPLRNLVGRLYIFSTGIFDEGHFIIFDKWAGTVTKITAFRTYLEVFSDMTTVSIPNEQFIKGSVKSYFGRKRFMYKWDLDVPYDIAANRVQQVIRALRDKLLEQDEINPDLCWVYLDRLGAHSKVVRVWFQAEPAGWSESLFYGNRILHEVQRVFESMDIPFAFPSQTLYLKAERAGAVGDPEETFPVAAPERPREGADESDAE